MDSDPFYSDSSSENIEEIPRRLRRFYRDKYPQSGFLGGLLSFMQNKKEEKVVKAVVSQIGDKEKEEEARREVRDFRERHNRFPEKSEYDILIDNLYSQSKKEISKEEEIKKTFDSLRKTLSKDEKEKQKKEEKKTFAQKKDERKVQEQKKEEKRRDKRNPQKETKDDFSQAFSSDPFSDSNISLKDLVSSSKKNTPKKSLSEDLDSDLDFDESEFSLDSSLETEEKKKKPKK